MALSPDTASAASALLEAKDLVAGYDQHIVLHGVNLTLRPGEVVALLGPNGSGKSTLLRCLLGEIPLRSGVALSLERPIARLKSTEIAKSIAFVPQEEDFAFDFTALEMVLLGRTALATTYFDSEEDREAALAAMQVAGCAEFASRKVTQLSGGERQRVIMARALAQSTSALLLDEPSSHLDVRHGLEMAQLFRQLAGEGRGLLVAIHDLNLAGRFCDRAVLLSDGVVAAEGPTDSVLRHSALDEAYRVRFRRIETEDGLIVVAKS